MDIQQYLSADGAPSQAQFAKQLGVTQGLVWQWLNGRTRITAERCIAIERATAGKVTRHELRPDLYSIESRTHAAAKAVPAPEDGYRESGVPDDGPPPCDEAARESAA